MLKLLILLVLSCSTIVVRGQPSKNSCSIRLPTDVKGFAPVILTSTTGDNFDLFKPTGEVTYLSHGTKLHLFCTGNKNFIESLNADSLELKCYKGKFKDSNNNVYQLSELICKFIPSSTLRITNEECSNGNGYIYQTGFDINGQFYGPVFEICYSTITEKTLYTHNILNGAAMNNAVSEGTRRAFTAKGMKFSTSKANSYYLQKNQINLFEQLFGSDQTYIDAKNFLARGHLSADADFIFGYEKLSTYYYVNVAAEFQPINVGNWLRVEELARAVSASYGDDMDAYNGYMGILELPNKKGDLVKVYLDDDKQIAVPKYYYKILVHQPSDAAIVFVTVNNPYIKDGRTEEICTNVCKQSGLIHDNFPDVSKGYTFCCTLKEFKKVVESLPDGIEGSKLLTKTP